MKQTRQWSTQILVSWSPFSYLLKASKRWYDRCFWLVFNFLWMCSFGVLLYLISRLSSGETFCPIRPPTCPGKGSLWQSIASAQLEITTKAKKRKKKENRFPNLLSARAVSSAAQNIARDCIWRERWKTCRGLPAGPIDSSETTKDCVEEMKHHQNTPTMTDI